jgi:hypothetical protein
LALSPEEKKQLQLAEQYAVGVIRQLTPGTTIWKTADAMLNLIRRLLKPEEVSTKFV